MIFYRGMSLEEKELFESGQFNNISWWSDEFEIPRLYSKGALVKIDLEVTDVDKTYFKNGAHGRDIEYEGYGQHNEEEHFYSISGNLLKTKIKSYEFFDISDIVPKISDNLNVIKNSQSYEVMMHKLSKNGIISHQCTEKSNGLLIKNSIRSGAIFLYSKDIVHLFLKDE